MLSRVADSLYWMSRYLERAEHSTRLLDVNLNLMLDESGTSADRRWLRVLQALGKPKGVEWTGDPYALTRTLTFDTGNKASILSCIIAARENSRHVREQISTEQWHQLNSLYLQVTRPQLQSDLNVRKSMTSEEQPTDFLQQVREAVHQFQGVSDSTMSHGEGWQFIQVGRYIERASATALLLEAYHEDLWGQPDRPLEGNEYLDWMGLLRSATAFEAYCKVYTADLTPDRILEFLLLNRDFPHALRYSIDGIRQALDAIQRTGGRRPPDELLATAGRLHAMLRYTTINEILEGNPGAFLHSIREQCQQIHELIYRYYVQYSIQSALAV